MWCVTGVLKSLFKAPLLFEQPLVLASTLVVQIQVGLASPQILDGFVAVVQKEHPLFGHTQVKVGGAYQKRKQTSQRQTKQEKSEK